MHGLVCEPGPGWSVDLGLDLDLDLDLELFLKGDPRPSSRMARMARMNIFHTFFAVVFQIPF